MNNGGSDHPNGHVNGEQEQEQEQNGGGVSLDLSLSLSLPGFNQPPLPTPPKLTPEPPASTTRVSRSGRQKFGPGKSETIPVPYPWATNRRAKVHSLNYLLPNGILKIKGKVQCEKCHRESEIEYDLVEKFKEVASFIVSNQWKMHDRAPEVWFSPKFENCKSCDQKNCLKPINGKKKTINWLFLFLGQTIGNCKLAQLKYFCKHTGNHKTGAKDRLVYTTYLTLCNQLDPNGPRDL